jgi:photosystem II stability/assembly factor-like uncharacterized protein
MRLAAAPDNRIYFHSSWPQRLMISRDSGATWQEGERLGSTGSLAVSPSHPDTIYVSGVDTGSIRGAAPVIMRTTDSGLTWEIRNRARPTGEILIDPADVSVVYSIGQGVVLRSVDGAKTFDAYATYSPDDMPMGASIAERGVGRGATSADGSRTWFVSVVGSFYRGVDRAVTWTRLADVPFGGAVKSVSASPYDPLVLFAVADEDELWAYREPDPTP